MNITGYVIMYCICHILTAICSCFVSVAVKDLDDDHPNIFFSICFGPVSIVIYSVLVWSQGNPRENQRCDICDNKKRIYRFDCCKKCIQDNNIKNKFEIKYYQKEREIKEKIEKEEVQERITILENLYSNKDDKDAENKKEILY